MKKFINKDMNNGKELLTDKITQPCGLDHGGTHVRAHQCLV